MCQRLVLNTNIFISALFWDGNERRTLCGCYKGKYHLITSPDILDEVERVLRYKFEVPDAKISGFLEEILMLAEVVFPVKKVDIIKDDPSDNMILETAEAGNADIIVSGDKHLLNLSEFGGIHITRAGEL